MVKINSDAILDEEDDFSPSVGGTKKILLLIALCVVIISLSVGSTIVILSLRGEDEQLVYDDVPVEKEEAQKPKPAIYYPIKPPIIVNFDARGRQRYMQAELTLLTRENDVIMAVELHLPMIRNALNLLIGGLTYEEVQTAEGKELLRLRCLQELQQPMEKEIGKPGIEQVLFTNIVMQ